MLENESCLDRIIVLISFSVMWQRYQRLIKQKPLLTSSITGAGVMVIGDLLAQTIKIKGMNSTGEEDFDFRRTFCMGTFSGLIMAPTFLFWFRRLDRWFPGNSVRNATIKVIANHAAVAIPFNALALTYTVTSESLLSFVLDGAPFDKGAVVGGIEHRCKADLFKLFVASSAVWVPVNMLNFLFVPSHLRVLPTIFTSLGWNTFLSHTAHGDVVVKTDKKIN